jgi:hypothetical protein
MKSPVVSGVAALILLILSVSCGSSAASTASKTANSAGALPTQDTGAASQQSAPSSTAPSAEPAVSVTGLNPTIKAELESCNFLSPTDVRIGFGSSSPYTNFAPPVFVAKAGESPYNRCDFSADGQGVVYLAWTSDPRTVKIRTTPDGPLLPFKPPGATVAYYGPTGAWVVYPNYVLVVGPDQPSYFMEGVTANIMNIFAQRIS